MHAAGQVYRAGTCMSVVLILEHEGPAGPGDVCSLEMAMLRACYGHGENNFCVLFCFVLFCFVWLATLGMPVVAPGTAAGPF